jgi:hypothetical protein
MEKAIICMPEEMCRLQYAEESKMTLKERLTIAFGMLELSKAFLGIDDLDRNIRRVSDIEWITLKMLHD